MLLRPGGRAAVVLLTAMSVFGDGNAAAGDLSASAPNNEGETLDRLARDYLAIDRAAEPGDAFLILDEASLQKREQAQDQVTERLKLLNPLSLNAHALRTEYSILAESLESQRALRVCHAERWDLNHITGWQVWLPQQAATQPTASGADRARALRRFGSLPAYIDADISNLKKGLASGYSVPQTVVKRVLGQVDALAATIPSPDGPFDGPARRSKDAAFQLQWRALVADALAPAIRRFAEFLQNEYLPRARASIGLWDQPDGEPCYAALLRRETTLPVTADATYDLGEETAARSTAELKRMGARLFATSDVGKILQNTRTVAANRFASPEVIVSYASQMLTRSTRMSAPDFFSLPRQAVEIAPLPSYQQGSGISSHYEAADDVNRAAVYRISLDHWQEQTRGAVAVTVVHEGVPGHHLQREAARSSPLPSVVAQLGYNSAYVEGWANYVERLCDEIGVYDNPYAAIFRRSVLGRSLVIDPAIHVRRWNRDRARQYLSALGQSEQEADELIDRIAVQPAQLTSYEYGGLEILRLREHAKQALGSRFNIREFHARILANGAVPLMTLRAEIEDWLDSSQRKK